LKETKKKILGSKYIII